MTDPMPRIAVLVPCYNEEAAIGKVVRDFKAALPEADTDDHSGLPVVNITLPAELRDALATLTAANIGKPLPIRVDGKVVSEPHVNEPISGGQLQISGVDRAEADRIAAALQSCFGGTARTAG